MTIHDDFKRDLIQSQGGEFYEIFPADRGNPFEDSKCANPISIPGVTRKCIVQEVKHYETVERAIKKYSTHRLLNVRMYGEDVYFDRYPDASQKCFVLMYYVY